MDINDNRKLLSAIERNLIKNVNLKEITLVGFRLTKESAQTLNHGIMSNKSVEKIRLSFCIHSKEIF